MSFKLISHRYGKSVFDTFLLHTFHNGYQVTKCDPYYHPQRHHRYRLDSPWKHLSKHKRNGKVTKCLMTAQGLIGCLYSPCRVRFPLTIQYHRQQNMSITYFGILYTYRFTRSSVTELCSFTSNRVNRYFISLRPGTAPFLTLHCVLALSVPFQKKPPSGSFFHYTSFTQPYSGFVTPLTFLGLIYN